jgi:hypothetical protein
MNRFKGALAVAVAIVGFTAAAPKVEAGVDIAIGPEPVCPYGYYDQPPYACAPYGYYGPEWFVGGAFIGAGRWFHGRADFRGHVDNRFDVHHGYNGPLPNHGDHLEASRSPDHNDHFRGNEVRDGRGHAGGGRH